MFKSLFLAALLASAQPEPADDPVARVQALLEAGDTGSAAFEAAARDLEAAARGGNGAAMVAFGVLRAQERVEGGAPADWFERAMDSGDPEAAASGRLHLALERYRAGEGAAARALLDIDTPLPDAQEPSRLALLGRDLLLGIGGPANPEYGQALINSALARGYEGAGLIETAGLYWNETGADGAPRHADRALRMFQEAARLGSASSAWRYAMLALQTGGDPGEAHRYVAWASDQGLVQAMISRAVMLAIGQGVAPDPAAARDWYARAAATGSAHAARGLGAMLVTAEGGPADAARGYALLDLAAEGGDPIAVQLLETPPASAAPRPAPATVAGARASYLQETGLKAEDFS
ncbi:MAG: tetratricopeptide repeat protein [Oceanicaulis sp.]